MVLRDDRQVSATAMITTRAVPALLPAHHRRVAQTHVTPKDFADPLTSSDLVLIKAGQALAPAYERAIGSSPKVSGKAWRLAALLSFPLSPLRGSDGGLLLSSRVGRGVSAAPDHTSAVAFGSGRRLGGTIHEHS